MNLFLSLISSPAAKRLIISLARTLAKRTDNHIDDDAVELFAEVLGVSPASGKEVK